MKDRVSVLKVDKNYAEFFKDVCLDNMDLMELIVDDDEEYADDMKLAKKTKKKYMAKIDDLCLQLKKRLHRHDSDSDDQYHGS